MHGRLSRSSAKWPSLAATTLLILTVAGTGALQASWADGLMPDDPLELRPAAADCAYHGAETPDAARARLWHQLSSRAEALTRSLPSTPDATTSSRHRAALHPGSGYSNFVDAEIFGKMKQDGIVPTGVSTDAEFVRRVTIDLTGVIPDADTIKTFLADPRADKRAAYVEQLLSSPAFVDRWTMWFGDLVQNVQFSDSSREFYPGRNLYYNFIKSSISVHKPYDQMVRELLSGKGDSFVDGPPNYWVRQIQNNGPVQDTYDNLSAQSGSTFLAMPLLCLSCHNGLGHLEQVNSWMARKARLDFWKNAAFFAQTSFKESGDVATGLRKTVVSDNPSGSYKLNTTSGNKTPRVVPAGQPAVVSPAFFLTGEQPAAGENARDAYGRMLTANPQFARATVNYVWKEIFGLGIVEPANSFDLSRLDPSTLPDGLTLQPTHPQLLTELADSFVAGNYDLRALLRQIVTSDAYQLSSRYTVGTWNEAWTPYYARHYPRRMMAEALLDSIFKATAAGQSFNVNGLGAVTHAMALPDTLELGNGAPYGRFLNTFGRGDRDIIARTSDSSISQALTLLNDPLVISRIKVASAGTNSVSTIMKATQDPAAIADSLYLATLSRHPTPSESAAAVSYLRSGTLARKTEDLQFALLNKLEFLFK
jgi:hypothetical protein